MERSEQGVLALFVVDWLAERLPSSLRHRRVAAVALILSVPWCAAAIAAAFGSPPSTLSTGVCSTYTTLNALAFAMARWGWGRLIGLTPRIIELVRSEGDLEAIAIWLKPKLDTTRQAWISLLAGFGAVGLAYIVRDHVSRTNSVSVQYALTIVLTAALGVNTVYWLVQVPLLLLRVSRLELLRLRWTDALATSAIRDATRLTTITAFAALTGLFFFLLPVLWTLSLMARSPILIVLVILIASFSASTVLWVGIGPQIMWWRLAKRTKRKWETRMWQHIPSEPSSIAGRQDRDEILLHLQVLDHVSRAPTAFIARDTVVQCLAMIAVGAAPYVLAALLKHKLGLP